MRMTTNGSKITVFVLAALLLPGCAGKVRHPGYYMRGLLAVQGPAAGRKPKAPGGSCPALRNARVSTSRQDRLPGESRADRIL